MVLGTFPNKKKGVQTPCLIVKIYTYKYVEFDNEFLLYFKVLKNIKLRRGEPHECEGNFR